MTKTILAPKGGISQIEPSIDIFRYDKNPIHMNAPKAAKNALNNLSL